MRRRPPPRPTALIPTVSIVLLLAAALAACGDAAPTSQPASGAGAAQSASGAGAAPAASEFGGTDLAWVELMIPMDEQLLPVLDLVRSKASDPSLVALAGELRGVYDTELPRLRALSDQAGLPRDNPHKGHKMPGLVDADRLAVLRAGAGADFERQAVDCLREHLDQLARLANSEMTNGTSPTVKALAQQVAQSRSGASARLPK
ncbi:DUF305 domain-containing protein [Dactylosporangium sp. CA-233914]|uniref:DUF305 domain-containing protein n=1 Tax=Dactylosporangium sp. CA-233914 TaxID=3239934 RepID=UPI003D8C6C50